MRLDYGMMEARGGLMAKGGTVMARKGQQRSESNASVAEQLSFL